MPGPTAAELAGGFALPDTGDLPGRTGNEYMHRLAALPAGAQRLALLAAADPVGDSALVFRAAQILGLDPMAAQLATAAGLLEIGARVRFRHPLVRSAVYRAAAVRDRHASHAALAAAPYLVTDPDRRAWHRAHATAGPDEAVAAELISSACWARGRGGAAAAAAFWERAVALTPDAGDRAGRALAAAEAKYAAGDFEAAQALLAAAEIGPLDELGDAQLQRMRAQVAFAVSRGSDAPPLLLRAAQRLEPLDAGLAQQTYLQAVVAAVYAGLVLADEADVQAVARGARSAPSGPLLSGPALAAAARPGHPADRRLPGRRGPADRGAAPVPGAAAGAGLAVGLVQPGRDGSVGRRGVAGAGLPPGPAGPGQRRPELAAARARLPGREPDPGGPAGPGGRAADRAGEHRPGITGAAALPCLPLLLAAWRGDAGTAADLAETLTRSALARGAGAALSYAEYAEAVLHNGLGNYRQAAEAARCASQAGEVVISSWALPELVEAAVRSDRRDQAAMAVDQLTAVAAATGTSWARGAAARGQALLAPAAGRGPAYRGHRAAGQDRDGVPSGPRSAELRRMAAPGKPPGRCPRPAAARVRGAAGDGRPGLRGTRPAGTPGHRRQDPKRAPGTPAHQG